MPGIITHNRIFTESIRLLSRRKKKSYLLKSIDTLFNSPENLRAGLFGSIGPNIFDYIPRRTKNSYFGHRASFFLHNGGAHDLLTSMIGKIYSCQDKNNEWSSVQRAYLYGYISHIISDALIHPFVFFWSGFPENYVKKEIYYFREQNLLFSYNIDNYYLNTGANDDFHFDVNAMLPVRKIGRINRLDPSIKHFILESLNQVYPDIYRELTWREDKVNPHNYTAHHGYLDLIPLFIRLSYHLKRSDNPRVVRGMKFLRKKNLIFSDFLVRYPDRKRVNTHLLNMHMDRWEYPAGRTGLRYESIDNLFAQSCDKIVEIWERIEASLWDSPDTGVFEEFSVNAYTGEKKKGFFEMKKKNPLRFYLKY